MGIVHYILALSCTFYRGWSLNRKTHVNFDHLISSNLSHINLATYTLQNALLDFVGFEKLHAPPYICTCQRGFFSAALACNGNFLLLWYSFLYWCSTSSTTSGTEYSISMFSHLSSTHSPWVWCRQYIVTDVAYQKGLLSYYQTESWYFIYLIAMGSRTGSSVIAVKKDADW